MKRIAIILSIAAVSIVTASCNQKPADKAQDNDQAAAGVTAAAGSIVYFNLDKILQDYDMANELRSVAETKINSIQQEVNRRGNSLQKKVKEFQDKVEKGLYTRSTAEVQGQKIQNEQNSFQKYAAEKEQEIAEEQQVMINQIADAIKTFLDDFRVEKGYTMILSTQGNILPAPVAAADSTLDITDDILEGLNQAYVKTKGQAQESK